MSKKKSKQFGKFKLIRKIATGGMGEIFLARHVDHPKSRPPIALKRILGHRAKDQNFIRMFLREAKIIAQLNHPNLTRILDFGKEQDTFYMTMEYVEGHNLDEVITKAGDAPSSWSLGCSIEVIRQALAGMDYAHDKNDRQGKSLDIVHLDLSPHNIMISRDGTVKILDFGVSKAAYEDDQKAYNALRGTYAYMSPEQCKEKAVDRRSDLFTLGILLYELSTGEPLFRKQPSEFMVLKAITEGLIPPPSNVDKNYPPELEKILDRSLAVKVEDRFQSAKEFSDALDELEAKYNFTSGPEVLKKALDDLWTKQFVSETDEDSDDDELSSQSGDEAEVSQDSSDKSEKPADVKAEDAVDNPQKSESSNSDESRRSETFQKDDVAAMSPADRDEWLLMHKRQMRRVAGIFSVLFVLACAALGGFYQYKTGWIKETAGSTIYVPSSGKLYISTIPEGAKVFVNLKEQKTVTPMLLGDMPFDENLQIEVVLSGYESSRQTFRLNAQTPLDAMLVQLEKK